MLLDSIGPKKVIEVTSQSIPGDQLCFPFWLLSDHLGNPNASCLLASYARRYNHHRLFSRFIIVAFASGSFIGSGALRRRHRSVSIAPIPGHLTWSVRVRTNSHRRHSTS